MNESEWSIGEVVLKGEICSARRKIFLNATLSATNSFWIGLKMISGPSAVPVQLLTAVAVAVAVAVSVMYLTVQFLNSLACVVLYIQMTE